MPLRFYEELAPWWPLISPVEDYAEEAETYAELLDRAEGPVRTVLELGSGGGHNAHYLKARYTLALTDLSSGMLAVSRALNPDCEHIPGDMRTLRLGRTFDAVFIHDAIHYMRTEADLAAALETAAVHCRPGGALLLAPDDVAETFEEGTCHGGSDAEDGRGVRFVEWTYAPAGTSNTARTEYAFVLRAADGSVTTAHETHEFGLFARDVWLRLLDEAGFEARVVLEDTTDDRPPREFFVGTRHA